MISGTGLKIVRKGITKKVFNSKMYHEEYFKVSAPDPCDRKADKVLEYVKGKTIDNWDRVEGRMKGPKK